jgi:hypothetical protein
MKANNEVENMNKREFFFLFIPKQPFFAGTKIVH